MKTLLSVAIATLLLAQPAAHAAPDARAAAKERSADVLKRRSTRLQQRAMQVPLADGSFGKVTEEQVGDADSFGRAVKYLEIGRASCRERV